MQCAMSSTFDCLAKPVAPVTDDFDVLGFIEGDRWRTLQIPGDLRGNVPAQRERFALRSDLP
jgi:hypothetical protein